MTNDDELALKLRKIANHGQSERYYHDVVGCNSRLDAIQAVVLSAKLKHLDEYNLARRKVADFYDQAFSETESLLTPNRAENSSHVFHQYTLRVANGKRDELKTYLDEQKVPNMIYYPVPLYKQKAFRASASGLEYLPNTEVLCQQVISLPIHSEMSEKQLQYISEKVNAFFK